MKIFQNEKEVKLLDFGIVPAGEQRQFNFIVYNDSEASLENLIFEVSHPELSIIKFPSKLQSKEKAELIIEWSPSVTLKQGLKAELNIRGKELYA